MKSFYLILLIISLFIINGTNCFAATTTSPPSAVPISGASGPPTGGVSPAPSSSVGSLSLPNPLGTTSVQTLLGRVIKYITGIAGSVALIVFIYGGVMWLISGGKKETVDKGKSAIKYSILGLVIIFTSYILVNFIISILTKFT